MIERLINPIPQKASGIIVDLSKISAKSSLNETCCPLISAGINCG
jgi:hypothetical protein